MGSEGKPAPGGSWREKTAAALSSGSSKFKVATQSATKTMASAMETSSSKVKTGWRSTRENWNAKVQPKLSASFNSAREAAQRGSTAMKTGMTSTREKIAQSKAGQRAVAASRNLAQRLDWRHRAGTHGKAVFGTPLEVVVQRQGTTPRPVPRIVSRCVDYLVQTGLQTEYLFREPGQQDVIQKLVRSFDQDSGATVPQGTDPKDVAALLRLYFQMLPEPVLTYELYQDVVAAGGDARRLHGLLRSLPPANHATLECLTALLLRTSNLSPANQMTVHDLAVEFAPALLWPRPEPGPGSSPARTVSPRTSGGGSGSKPHSPTKRKLSFGGADDAAAVLETSADGTPGRHSRQSSGMQNLDSETPAVVTPTHMPLNDTTEEEAAIREAVHVLIERHDVVFADASEELWQELGL